MLRVKNNLEAWYQSTQTSGNLSLTDLSGKGRTITAASSQPVIQANVQNGKQSIYFNGSRNPLKYTGSLSGIKHIFILASYEDATFSGGYKGLLSDVATNAFLLGDTGGTKFFDESFGAFGFEYRKADIAYPDNNQVAPMSNQLAIIEISFTAGVGMDGIQIGQDRSDTARRWKGHFLEAIFYSAIQDEFQKYEIYRHFGEEWALWREKTAGIPIFPFPAQNARQMTPEQKVFLSEPYTGDTVALVRGDAKKTFDFTFESRRAIEYLAADKFNKAKFPLGKWVYRDYSFFPAVDTTLRFTSTVKEQGAGTLKSYAFTAKEV